MRTLMHEARRRLASPARTTRLAVVIGRLLGIAFLVASGLTAGVGWHRYRQAERAIRTGTDLPQGLGAQVVVLAVVAIIVVVALTVLV